VRFDEFWKLYPTKVARRSCEDIWKRRKLDACADDAIAGVRRWQSSDRWQRGFIPNPATFLSQERWKDTPPAGEPKKGELRLRETTPQETADAQARARFFELMKANLGKSEAEIHAMMRAA
jgi:hypothetical protein